MGDGGFFAFFLSTGAVALALLLGPVGQAIGRRLSGTKPATDSKTGLTTGEMAAERIVHLEERVMALEERLDFAERLLARPASEADAEPVKTPS